MAALVCTAMLATALPRVAGEACPAGFAPLVHAATVIGCAPCSKGYRSPDGVACTPCPPGSFQPRLGAAACELCPDGQVSSAGETHCAMCPSGKRADEGRTRCVWCPVGLWSHAGDAQCTPCPFGTYNAVRGSPGCKDCGKGFFNPRLGASQWSDCIPCPRGHMCPFAATAGPIRCPPGQFSPATRAQSCAACPWMFDSTPGRTGCAPTLEFYGITASLCASVLIVIALLLQCPRKEWSSANGILMAKRHAGHAAPDVMIKSEIE